MDNNENINYYYQHYTSQNIISQDSVSLRSYFNSNKSNTSKILTSIEIMDSVSSITKQSIAILFPLALHQLSLFFLQSCALVSLVLVLAAFGTSLRIREMYVKALLKIFEYATNINREKLKMYDELLPLNEQQNEAKKRREMARLKRKRLESFKLNQSDELSDDQIRDKNDNLKVFKNLNHLDANETTTTTTTTYKQKLFEKFKTKIGLGNATTPPSSSSETPKNSSPSKRINEKNDQQTPIASDEECLQTKSRSYSDIKRDFQLGDVMDFVRNGIDSIIDDNVTKRFTTEELTVWNLLTRTNQQYEYVSFRVTVLWLLGFILRYCILFPFRLLLFFFACSYTLLTTYLIGLLPDGRIKRFLNYKGMQVLHRILSRVFSAIIRIHNKENRAKSGSICVANHTSPIDVIILSTDNTYSLIGQRHSGFTGMMQIAFSRASNHIWFDRSESKDRSLVSKRMREHTLKENNPPILIFPEGTCINNTSVMMFKKGCFEIDATIYPVAIKYDPRFGDAFWNSQKHSMLQYLILMMTSWAIVVDVYYLPPMKRENNEDVLQFTNRVKAEIVKKGSFVDLNWDGMLKRSMPKLDLMYEQQQKYVKQLNVDVHQKTN